jgi:pectate lyase-like protein
MAITTPSREFFDEKLPGSVRRLFADKFGDIVSVKDFGAVCDGVTDDTVAVNAAIATGMPVVTPATTCRTTGALGTIPAGSIIINGVLAGAGGSGAPLTSKYLLQTADGSLPNAQAMGALGTGLVKNTTSTGVQSIAAAGTDYAGLASTNAFTGTNTFTPSTAATAGVVGNREYYRRGCHWGRRWHQRARR